jgi:bifunctional enzyme CysN/CysC
VDKSAAMPWYLGPPLLSYLETVHIASDGNLADLRFPVQYVVRPSGDVRGFAGTIASGILRQGDDVMVLPSGRQSRISSIVTYDGQLEEAFAPMAATVTLADEIDISRGDMLVHSDNAPHLSAQIEAMVVWMGERPFASGRTYWIKQTTRAVIGQIAELRYGVDVNTLEKRPVKQLLMNEVGHAVLELNQPIAYDPYKINPATGSFIIIDRNTNNTVGAGMILELSEHRGRGDLWAREPIAAPLPLQRSLVSVAEREQRLGQRGATVLLFGLTGAGKATIAYALERRLFDAGHAATVLKGPDMRQGLTRDLGFTADDRSENLRRSVEVARILNDSGLICICACVAPYDAVREKARQVVGTHRFLSVYLSAPVQVCRQRDWTGAYRMADQGALGQFPGVSVVFEEPSHVDLELPTHRISVEESVNRLLELLRERRFIE